MVNRIYGAHSERRLVLGLDVAAFVLSLGVDGPRGRLPAYVASSTPSVSFLLVLRPVIFILVRRPPSSTLVPGPFPAPSDTGLFPAPLDTGLFPATSEPRSGEHTSYPDSRVQNTPAEQRQTESTPTSPSLNIRKLRPPTTHYNSDNVTCAHNAGVVLAHL